MFDWNRVGLDCMPRELHIAESLASMDFNDFEPRLIPKQIAVEQGCEVQPLVNDQLFAVDAVSLKPRQSVSCPMPRCMILGVVHGEVTATADGHAVELRAGQFCLVPACLQQVELRAGATATFLKITPCA